MRLASVLTTVLASSTFLATVGYADSISTIPNDGSLYGTLENSSIYGWCGATSITNSLQYLQNMYPTVYKDKPLITGGSLEQTRTQILKYEEGVTVTGTPPNAVATGNPATNTTVWNSKIQYINNVAPGTTRFAAMMDDRLFGTFTPSAAGYLSAGDIQRGLPTDTFLQRELAEGEDIEIGINFALDAVGGGHMVTLTSMDSDGHQLTFLDPNKPEVFITTNFETRNGFLSFFWNNGSNTPAQAYIYEAWAESPVPLPDAAYSGAGLLLGLLGIAWFRSKKVALTGL